MRLLLLVCLALAASGCVDPAPGGPVPDTEARRLLAALDGTALDGVFRQFAAREYRAVGVVTQTDDGRVVSRDTLYRGWGADAAPLANPLAEAVSDDPPTTDPAVADAFRVETRGDTAIGGRRFVRVEAVLEDTTREVGVRRIAGWVAPGSDAVAAIEVDRRTASALFSEDSRVAVWREGEVWRVVTESTTDVPLSDPTTVRAEWVLIPGR